MFSTPKPIWRSRTFWFNVLTAFVGILAVLGQSPLTAEFTEHILVGVGIINVVLRLVTTRPVELTSGDNSLDPP